MNRPANNWLASARITDNPAGDLIADMRDDDQLPTTFPSIDAMRSYLRSRNACDGAIRAVPSVWRRYKRWQNHQRTSL